MFLAKFNCSTFFKHPKENGNGPVKRLLPASKSWRFLSNPISYGRQPDNWLFSNKTSSNVDDAFPMLLGIEPVNLLLANVR